MSAGKFCSECGAPLGERTCPRCGAKLPARAKFCAECGAPAPGGAGGAGGAGAAAGRRAPAIAGAVPLPRSDRMAWYVTGVAVIALLVVVVVLVARKSGPPASAQAAAVPGGGGGGGGGAPPGMEQATTDISKMSPQEQADRLFNRVMTAHESGDTQQVAFFGPMALQAYANLGGNLNADARLHVGLIDLALGQPDPAAAQGDTILRGSRTHLFGWLLEARAAEEAGDSAAARRSYRNFLANFAAERAKKLPEYAEHAQMLDDARAQAQRFAARGRGS